MPVQVSYPGVYIQELASAARTISGVATSITAFVGRAARGPCSTAVEIHNQGDYDRQFGGLQASSPMSFAVRDFFLNGGSTAIIVRLFKVDPSSKVPTNPTSVISVGNAATPVFQLVAASPGSWGQYLRVTLDNDVSGDTATALGVQATDLFNLTVTDTSTNTTEVHRNVTLVESVRRLDRVLADTSNLVAWPPAKATDLVKVTSGDPTTLASNLKTFPQYDAITAAALPSSPIKATDAQKAVQAQDGTFLDKDAFQPNAAEANKTGLWALEQVDLFNLLVIPPTLSSQVDPSQPAGDLDPQITTLAATYCEKRRAFLILDGGEKWDSKTKAAGGVSSIGTTSANAALFFPRLTYPNPFNDGRMADFISGGAIAGIMARTDSERGVWKAPAGLDATLIGVPQLAVDLTDLENGDLNKLAINCLRTKPAVGPVVWGSRTLKGDDRLQSDWKYIPVRRTALYIEESVFRGTQWVVFEPNDEPLWAQIRTNLGAFMQGLFLHGAFQGESPDQAYFVKCDGETTTQTDIDQGIVNIIVGFAPLKPAEFVVISLQQMAGQTA
jgi:phage tail sheath protein FI